MQLHPSFGSEPEDAIDNELFGGDPTTGIVAVERSGERNVRIYARHDGVVSESVDEIEPWIVVAAAEPALGGIGGVREPLEGAAHFNMRVRLPGWSRWFEVYRGLREAGVAFIAHANVAEQHLIDSGRGLFRGMQFDQLVRLQLDIETLGLDPKLPEARILMIALSTNGEDPLVLRADDLDEPRLIDTLNQVIHERDPDVIEGHNLFNFDLPFLAERSLQAKRVLSWGRDGSPVRFAREQRFKAGARSIPYQSAHVYGRHLIDTYQQVQRYDSAGNLESYGLKSAVDALGRTRTQRTFIAGKDIARTWNSDRERLVRYAIDDVLDVNTLSELALPTEFHQSQILPRGLQSIASGGPGEKVNDLLVRAYLAAGHSVPLPESPRGYPGGYTELRRVGAFSPVVKCDVESLYPAIMLSQRIAPLSDHLGVFLPSLANLTNRRLAAKRMERETSGHDRARWQGMQSSFKVLINSFYGYLGYGRGHFNDFDAAEAVTLHGQRIVTTIVNELEKRGASTIEIDTDGVFFQPLDPRSTLKNELALIDEISASLEPGVRLAHDGRYRGMLSLKLKNYALLDYDGRVILKGSSLRSRREEPFLRRFVHDAVPRLLEPERHGELRAFYFDIAERITAGELPLEEFCRTEMITDQTFRSTSNKRLADALGDERIGERVQVYQRADESLARSTEYQGDEDRTFLLRRLRDMAERFRPLYPNYAEFEYMFPAITTRTNIAALRDSVPARQLDLFSI